MRADLQEIPRPIPVENLDPDAVRIVRRLAEAGFEAYLVGGCVRDLLFGLRPKDFDVATSATPRDIRRLFRNCRIIGRRFRLAHVFFRDKIIEVATFRAAGPAEAVDALDPVDAGAVVETDAAQALVTDDEALAAAPETDGGAEAGAEEGAGGALLIRDDNVFGTAEQDAVRRDFTVNALFYDVQRQVILDYVGGVADVEARQIRTIGDARIRMREDPIRMLRAIRLAARMGCRIHSETWDAIREFRAEILHAAPPRIGEDLLRMYRGGAMLPALDMMRESGVLDVVLPELTSRLDGDAGEWAALRASLQVADARTQRGEPLTTPVQYALLLAPVLMEPAGDDGAARPVRTEEIAERLRPIAARIAISRRDSERVRQVLFTLPRLVPPAPGRRRRAPGPLVRRAFFPETVDLFEVLALATGDAREEAARWRRKVAEAPAQEPPPPRRAPTRPRRPSSRRRR